ncbi:MAG: hypothetical protein V2I43_08430 [Parvularcula sp.]|nr:hypothetical protein [Parvularcula sp.]
MAQHVDSAGASPSLVRTAEWNECAKDGHCANAARPDDVLASAASFADAQAFVAWHQKMLGPVRMAVFEDLTPTAVSELVAAVTPSPRLRVWLGACRPAEGFTTPSPDRRRVFGMAAEGPERMNPAGQICVGADCIECQIADLSAEGVETRWLYHAGLYQGIGIVVVEEGDL